jgi:hypothetical protein
MEAPTYTPPVLINLGSSTEFQYNPVGGVRHVRQLEVLGIIVKNLNVGGFEPPIIRIKVVMPGSLQAIEPTTNGAGGTCLLLPASSPVDPLGFVYSDYTVPRPVFTYMAGESFYQLDRMTLKVTTFGGNAISYDNLTLICRAMLAHTGQDAYRRSISTSAAVDGFHY